MPLKKLHTMIKFSSNYVFPPFLSPPPSISNFPCPYLFRSILQNRGRSCTVILFHAVFTIDRGHQNYFIEKLENFIFKTELFEDKDFHNQQLLVEIKLNYAVQSYKYIRIYIIYIRICSL